MSHDLPTQLLHGWERHATDDGVVWRPPGDRPVGSLRVRLEQRPLVALRQLVDAIIAGLPREARGSLDVSAPERLVTSEGELAVWARAQVMARTGPSERAVGMILGDRTYALVDAIATEASWILPIRHAARSVLCHLPLGLGALRRRPFVYEPPGDWDGVRGPTGTTWLVGSALCPMAILHVFDARPAGKAGELDAFLHRTLVPPPFPAFDASRPLRGAALAFESGLEGSLRRDVGSVPGIGSAVQTTASVSDGRYVYVVSLRATADADAEAQAVLDRLLGSIEPLPQPAPRDGLVVWE